MIKVKVSVIRDWGKLFFAKSWLFWECHKINLITFWCKILIFFKFKIKNSNWWSEHTRTYSFCEKYIYFLCHEIQAIGMQIHGSSMYLTWLSLENVFGTWFSRDCVICQQITSMDSKNSLKALSQFERRPYKYNVWFYCWTLPFEEVSLHGFKSIHVITISLITASPILEVLNLGWLKFFN